MTFLKLAILFQCMSLLCLFADYYRIKPKSYLLQWDKDDPRIQPAKDIQFYKEDSK